MNHIFLYSGAIAMYPQNKTKITKYKKAKFFLNIFLKSTIDWKRKKYK